MEYPSPGFRFGFLIPLFFVLPLYLPGFALYANVQINEVCYDPDGADSGKEWIELFNPTEYSIDLSGCKIYRCGTFWERVFQFPYYVLRPGRFVLVAESEVPNAHFYTSLSLQNGGSASDGIRFVDADSSYTDTLIYASPNTNLITNDWGFVATSLAPDVAEGYSLARAMDGRDTNYCAEDFIAESNPTPNAANRVYTDYEIYDPWVYNPGPGSILSVGIRNTGPFDSPYTAQFSIYNADTLIFQEDIQPLDFQDSLRIECLLPEDAPILYLNLELWGDSNLENNLRYFSPQGESSSAPQFSEIFPAPLPGDQEWIELSRLGSASREDFLLRDDGGGFIRFSLPPIPAHFVVCSNKESFLSHYPDALPALVVESEGWTALNNNGDILLLYDSVGLIDSLSYPAAISDKAFQKHMLDGNAFWKWAAPNPTMANDAHLQDLPEQAELLKVLGSPCSPKLGEKISISYKLFEASNRVNCRIYDLQGRLIATLADNQPIEQRGIVCWDGRSSGGRYAPRGLYIILWESQPESGGKILRRQLNAVIR